MSGPFALAAVSAVLRRLLTIGVGDVDLSVFGGTADTVTVHPPDLLQTGSGESAQLNLYLYRVTPNAGLRNESLPTRSGTNERLANQPLALDLHYLLSAYGAGELVAEALLGCGVQVLHEVPYLSREFIRSTWPDGSDDFVEQALAETGLDDQVEYLKITPETLSNQDMSNLWTTFQSKYRPSVGYLVTVVLIEANQPVRAALPVLAQGENDTGPRAVGGVVPPYPAITALKLPANAPAAEPGSSVVVEGHGFAGDLGDPGAVEVGVRLLSDRWQIDDERAVAVTQRSDAHVTYRTPTDVPAGIYRISVRVLPAGHPDEARLSNEGALLIAPKITADLTGTFPAGFITLDVAPELRPGQRVSVIAGNRELDVLPFTDPTNSLTFDAGGLGAGAHPVRVRVDGVDSLFVDRRDPAHPTFDAAQTITIA